MRYRKGSKFLDQLQPFLGPIIIIVFILWMFTRPSTPDDDYRDRYSSRDIPQTAPH